MTLLIDALPKWVLLKHFRSPSYPSMWGQDMRLMRPPPIPPTSGLVVWAQRAHRLSGAPDLLVVNLFELARKVLTVGAASVELECLAGLGAIAHALVELLKDGLVRRLEDGCPVEGTAPRGRRTRIV